MICPNCGFDNLPGSEECSKCLQDLTQLDRPVGQDKIERSLMDDSVGMLHPSEPITVLPTTAIHDAIQTMLKHDIGALLVIDTAGKLLGIFSERDLLAKVAGLEIDYAVTPVHAYMTKNPETVSASDSLAFALHKMDVGGYRHMPVVEEGRPVAVVSVRDMLRHITRMCKH
ncbi:MAG: cyclic nucleotide-binding/CBS domain-containing protein [Gemmataceae bacterium]